MSERTLTADDVHAIADSVAHKVAEIVAARSTTFGFVDARDPAEELGVSIDYVYAPRHRVRSNAAGFRPGGADQARSCGDDRDPATSAGTQQLVERARRARLADGVEHRFDPRPPGLRRALLRNAPALGWLTDWRTLGSSAEIADQLSRVLEPADVAEHRRERRRADHVHVRDCQQRPRASAWRSCYLQRKMPKQLVERQDETDRRAVESHGWRDVAVANPTFLLKRPGSRYADLQGLRELTVNGVDAIAALIKQSAEHAWCCCADGCGPGEDGHGRRHWGTRKDHP